MNQIKNWHSIIIIISSLNKIQIAWNFHSETIYMFNDTFYKHSFLFENVLIIKIILPTPWQWHYYFCGPFQHRPIMEQERVTNSLNFSEKLSEKMTIPFIYRVTDKRQAGPREFNHRMGFTVCSVTRYMKGFSVSATEDPDLPRRRFCQFLPKMGHIINSVWTLSLRLFIFTIHYSQLFTIQISLVVAWTV